MWLSANSRRNVETPNPIEHTIQTALIVGNDKQRSTWIESSNHSCDAKQVCDP